MCPVVRRRGCRSPSSRLRWASRWPPLSLAGEGRAELLDRHRPRAASTGGGVAHQGLDALVGRRRDAVQATEEGDLAVEEVGLHARPALEALPGRPTGSWLV